MKNYVEGFEKLVLNPELLNELSANESSDKDYPLAPEGLRVFWDTVCKYRGWKLEKNYYYNHYRILDEYNMRRAWGSETEMISELECLARA